LGHDIELLEADVVLKHKESFPVFEDLLFLVAVRVKLGQLFLPHLFLLSDSTLISMLPPDAESCSQFVVFENVIDQVESIGLKLLFIKICLLFDLSLFA